MTENENTEQGPLKRSASEDPEDEVQQIKKRRSEGPKFDVRILLQSKNAGAIIGIGGQNINRLRKDYNAAVHVPDCEGPERILSISANLPTVMKCLLDIIPTLEDYQQYKDTNLKFDCELRLLVHSSQLGCIIGRAGYKIKELREQTGTKIKAYSLLCPESTERVISIGGEPVKVVKCIETILKLLAEETRIKGSIELYDPFNHNPYIVDQYGGFLRQGHEGMGRYMRHGDRGDSGDRGSGGGFRHGGDGWGRGNRPMGRGGDRGGMMRNDRGNRGGFGRGGGSGGGGRGSRVGGGMNNGFGGKPGGNMGNQMGNMNQGGNQMGNQMGNMGGGMNMGGGNMGHSMGNTNSMGGNNLMGSTSGGDNSMNQTNFTQDTVGMGNQGLLFGQQQQQQQQATTTQQVSIPKAYAGAIIGRGGQRIQHIRQMTNASIQIDDPNKSSNERIITIKGNKQQIENAQFLLQQSVRNHSGGNF